ncbi:putative ankyrin repeat protein RBE_0220 [Haliotis asinina]|uniref:putative ankyrin repeat protein RBE_0220 n=1 Tax=Haliotis asinina TaxID=109174 RepID=UPI00353266E2
MADLTAEAVFNKSVTPLLIPYSDYTANFRSYISDQMQKSWDTQVASTTDASEDVIPSKTVPPAPVTTQNSGHHATPSQADRDLYDASGDGDLESVKRILAAGHVDINYRGGWEGWAPVMLAAWKGHVDIVDSLVGRGADVSLVDSSGNNILNLACMNGRLEIVKLILSLNLVDINARNKKTGMTAVDVARLNKHQQILDLLVSCGAH